MFLIVGLGNPGKKYAHTRHNAGVMVLDEFAEKHQLSPFRLDRESNALVAQGTIGPRKIILGKPQTFMNNSGIVVQSLLSRYGIQDTRYLVVVHDDIDLPLGKIRIVQNRGSAGHKGVESIMSALKTRNFIRMRIGIQPEIGKPKDTDQFVLKNFSKKEISVLKQAISYGAQALEVILKERVEKAMHEYNR